MKLIVVESPAKARTIEKFLGDGYEVAASYGHIRDLPSSARRDPGRIPKIGTGRGSGSTPTTAIALYVVQPDSRSTWPSSRAAKGADELLLATDEDREGEAISWHVLEVLSPKIPVSRITFHEITRGAINHAPWHRPRESTCSWCAPRKAGASSTGCTATPCRRCSGRRCATRLCAGRVQSVARTPGCGAEEERQAFQRAEYCDIEATLADAAGGRHFTRPAAGRRRPARGGRQGLRSRHRRAEGRACASTSTARAASDLAAPPPGRALARGKRRAQGDDRSVRRRRSPPRPCSRPPAAAAPDAQRTMRIAQRLYEGVDMGDGGREGLITYMRTDSLTLSEEALADRRGRDPRTFGAEYTNGPRRYKTSSPRPRRRPTRPSGPPSWPARPRTLARYLGKGRNWPSTSLIWKRTAGQSQMTDAQLDKTAADLARRRRRPRADVPRQRFGGPVPGLPERLRRPRPGHVAAGATPVPDASGADPRTPPSCREVAPLRHETQPPARFTEASLIKHLEEEGIGRPSTYAPSSRRSSRGTTSPRRAAPCADVRRHGRHPPAARPLRPLRRPASFTARMEEDLDGIASGEVDGRAFLDAFYRGSEAEGRGLLLDVARELPEIDYPAIPIGEEPEHRRAAARADRTQLRVRPGREGDDAPPRHLAGGPADRRARRQNARPRSWPPTPAPTILSGRTRTE